MKFMDVYGDQYQANEVLVAMEMSVYGTGQIPMGGFL